MRRAVASVLALSALALHWACGSGSSDNSGSEDLTATPTRIVSMAPSLTEIIFALGLEDRLVAVTRYCDYPPEALEIRNVGGFLDPNLEVLVSLDPDLVLLIQDHGPLKEQLKSLGLSTLQVDHSSIAGILQSIRDIAEACEADEAGRTLASERESSLEEVRRHVQGRSRPRVLIVVDREIGAGSVDRLWAAGPSTYLSNVLHAAGGVNALQTAIAAYPELSREGLISIDPDVIIDVVTAIDRGEVDASTAESDWKNLIELRAVRRSSVFVMANELMEIPGPRIVDAVEEVAGVLHPDHITESP